MSGIGAPWLRRAEKLSAFQLFADKLSAFLLFAEKLSAFLLWRVGSHVCFNRALRRFR